MPFSDSLTLNGATFALRSRNGDQTVRLDTTNTDPEIERTLTVRHSTSGKGAALVKRHNIVSLTVKTDAETGRVSTRQVSVTISESGDPDNTSVVNAVDVATDFILASGAIADLRNGFS